MVHTKCTTGTISGEKQTYQHEELNFSHEKQMKYAFE